jgi:hypothetical protein
MPTDFKFRMLTITFVGLNRNYSSLPDLYFFLLAFTEFQIKMFEDTDDSFILGSSRRLGQASNQP